jgi:hypothetical protein
MKPVTLAMSLALLVGTAGAALADKPGADWLPAEQVITKVKASGYTVIGKIEADNGRWEGEGLKNGQWMDFHADAKTGAVTFEKLD